MKIVLLDRDGTVIVDPPDKRVDRVEKIELFPDSIAALQYLAEHDFAGIFITNQSGIAEGRITEQDFEVINAKVLEMLAPSGLKIVKTYMVPQGSDEVNEWRKPGPGMLLQAAKDFDLTLANTYMVGDRDIDITAGANAGTKTILVQTGNDPATTENATYVAPTLLDAAHYIVRNS